MLVTLLSANSAMFFHMVVPVPKLIGARKKVGRSLILSACTNRVGTNLHPISRDSEMSRGVKQK